jgi:hypothetical protein
MKKIWEKNLRKKFNVKFCVLLKKNFYLYKMKMLNTKKTLVWTHKGKKILLFFNCENFLSQKKNVMVVLGGQCQGSIWWYEKQNMKIF